MRFHLGMLAAASLCTVYAGGIYEAKTTADFIISKEVSAKDAIFSFNGNKTLLGSKMIRIDPAKKYRVSVQYRTEGKAPNVYMGVVPYDGNKKNVTSVSVCDVDGTLTTLASPVKKGDSTLILKDASKWDLKTPNGCIVFNAKEDFSDLPNHDGAAHRKGGIAKVETNWKVELKKPVSKDYAAGTAVRQHQYNSSFIYCRTGRGSKDWTKLEGTISGVLKHGLSVTAFWPHTQYIRALFMAYGDKATKVEFKDFKIEEID